MAAIHEQQAVLARDIQVVATQIGKLAGAESRFKRGKLQVDLSVVECEEQNARYIVQNSDKKHYCQHWMLRSTFDCCQLDCSQRLLDEALYVS